MLALIFPLLLILATQTRRYSQDGPASPDLARAQACPQMLLHTSQGPCHLSNQPPGTVPHPNSVLHICRKQLTLGYVSLPEKRT